MKVRLAALLLGVPFGFAIAWSGGWAIAGSCPGPIATQLASGLWWSGCTIVGVAAGILFFFARKERRERAPDAVPALEP
jgi:hypothetical protein